MTSATVGAADRAPAVSEVRDDSSSRAAAYLVPAIAALMAAGLCAYGLTSRSLGFDEAASVTIAAQSGAALGHALAHDGGNMAGYYLLLHVLTGLFGNGLLVLRLPSVASVAATAALVTLLARTLFGARVALVSGLLTAVSLPLVFWGQSARGYAPMVALTCASYLAFVTLVERSEEGRPTGPAAISYAVVTALAVYMSLVAVLVVPAQLLMLVRRRSAIRPVVYALAFCALSWIPLLVLAVSRGSGQLFWVPRPTLKIERQVLDALSSAGLSPSFHRTGTSVALLVLSGLVLLVAAIRCTRGGWSHSLVLSWLLVPVVLAWLESLVGQPIFMPRNVVMAVPAAGVLLALGITDRRLALPSRATARRLAALPGGTGRRLEAPRGAIGQRFRWLPAAAVLAALITLRLLAVTASYGVSPEDWKGATAYVLDRSRSSDCIAFYPSDSRMAFRYYLRDPRSAPVPVLPATPWPVVKPFVEDYASLAPAQVTGCPRLWLVSSHEGQADGPPGSRANRARYLRLRAELAGLYPRRTSARFGYASTIHVELFTRG